MKALNNDSSMKLKPRSEHGTDCKIRDAVQFLMYNQTHKQGMKGQNSCSGTSCSGHHRLGDATSSCNKSNGFCHPRNPPLPALDFWQNSFEAMVYI